MPQSDAEGRTGVLGGAGDFGEGVNSSSEPESGAFNAEAARDTRAENGTEVSSEMTGGSAKRRCSQDWCLVLGRGGARGGSDGPAAGC
jgi:hypothetical protein